MKVTILTLGSRGDVQPYAGLALGLMARGHEVLMATPERFRWLGEGVGVPVTGTESEPLRALAETLGPDLVRRPAAVWRGLREELLGALEHWDTAVDGADLVVAHPQVFPAPVLARRHGAQVAFAATLPVSCPTAEYPCCYLMGRSRGALINRLTYHVIPTVARPLQHWAREWFAARGTTDLPRARWDLYHPDGTPVAHLHGHSQVVLRRPGDWPDAWQVTGYWPVDPPETWRPDPELSAFLEAGPPPVYVGFGSMVYRGDRSRLTRELVGPLLRRGERVLLVRGWALDGSQMEDEEAVHFLDAYEGPWHSWLFPKVKAAVHHAGPGTFGSALHAGRPQLCVPFAMDQPFWAHRSEAMGVAPPPLPMSRWSASAWAARLSDLLDGASLRENARDVAGVLANEDGVAVAVEAMEGLVEGRPMDPGRGDASTS